MADTKDKKKDSKELDVKKTTEVRDLIYRQFTN